MRRNHIKKCFLNFFTNYFSRLFPLQTPFELVKKLEEVRLAESRRSPRLADQACDTDFARLADMGTDRRRSTSYSIDMPGLTTGSG